MKVQNAIMVFIECSYLDTVIGSYYLGKDEKIYVVLNNIQTYLKAAEYGRIKFVSPYLICNEPILLGDLCYSTKDKTVQNVTIQDLYSGKHFFKVLAEPKQMQIAFEDVQRILDNDGKCKVEKLKSIYKVKIL